MELNRTGFAGVFKHETLTPFGAEPCPHYVWANGWSLFRIPDCCRGQRCAPMVGSDPLPKHNLDTTRRIRQRMMPLQNPCIS